MLDTISQAPVHSNKASKSSILLIEDEAFIRAVMLKMLNDLGYCPDCATNGTQALALAKSNRYEVILTDIGLPDMDGIQIAKTIRQYEQENTQPAAQIFALTAYAMDEVRNTCLAVGMDDVLAKPIAVEKLKAICFSC